MRLLSFFALGEALPPPLRNPATGSRHWYHGTDREFYDEHGSFGEPHDPGGHHDLASPAISPPPDPGGRLLAPERQAADYGEHAEHHWNTDLGVHFTSEEETARKFAFNGHYPQSRVAHCSLHLANPRHYASEFDMSHEAVRWAHQHGHHYLAKEQREDPDVEEHFAQGFAYSEIPEHGHLGYLDEHLSGGEAHVNHDIDRHGPDNSTPGTHLDSYLRLHPDREEITAGFKQHLQSQGHDGVTYGNEYEAPSGHTCAIAFDEDRIHQHHWEWTHADGHPEQPPRPPKATSADALVSPSWTPEHKHHWVDSEHQKIGRLVGHFASGTPLYRQPKPEWNGEEYEAQRAISDEHATAWAEQNRHHTHRWRHEVRRALSRGDLEPQEAWNNGYKGSGHDEDHRGQARYHDTDRHNLGWQHLPQTLYHVTSNKAGVLAAETLKSRKELAMDHGGSGLGGGEDDTISVTDDLDTARHIHRALHEYHDVLHGRRTVQHMVEEAKQGGYLHQVIHLQNGSGAGKHYEQTGELPEGMRALLKGRTVERHGSPLSPMTAERAKQEVHPDAEPADEGWQGSDGTRFHIHFSRPMTEEETLHARSSHYKAHAAFREHAGGPMDPGFISNSPRAMSECHPSQFAVVRLHPKPGARGYRVSALGEWRTVDGSSLHIGGLEDGHFEQHEGDSPKEAALTEPYLPRLALPGPAVPGQATPRHAKEAKSGNGFLTNPYHDHDEWFHGSIGGFDDLDPQAVHDGHRPPGNGSGGPQMNKLLGVHFSALHEVAHHFSGPHHSTAHGRVYHAKLRMTNARHFENESALLKDVWSTTMRSDHFHDEKHDSNHRWNYGEGATREGINRRLDRGTPKGRPGPESSMESYFMFHPAQKSIAQAYVQHLRYEGHDGITYGNDVEGPRRHHCAIAFDPKTIETVSVDRMHPHIREKDIPRTWPEESQRLAKERRPGEVSHDHIASIHNEPQDLLDEVERYHNGGLLRHEPGHSYFGPNTGKGEWRYHQSALGAKQQTVPHPGLVPAIEKVVHQVREDEGAGGQCGWVAEILANRYGWEHHGGYYHHADGRVIGDHQWNVHGPSGTIIDATSDQHGEHGGTVRFVPPDHPDHHRYRYAESEEDDEARFTEAGDLRRRHGDYWWTGGPTEHSRAYDRKVRDLYESPARQAAKQPAPLQIEPGLYYRLHHRDRPFSREDASTRNAGEPPHPDLAKYWHPKPGYSGFWNPHHLGQYLDEMGWTDKEHLKGSQVLAFRGTPVGEGADGEPRVMPHTDRPEQKMAWSTFQRRLDHTENGYGRWSEHTWGDGPHGQQVDDGYRTISEMFEKDSALQPGYTHEHSWLPDHGIFSPSQATLDPVLWTRGQRLRPRVRETVLDRMDRAVSADYPDWRAWTRTYLAGGSASYWWGNRDLDILVGVDYARFRKAHPDQAAWSDDQISAALTALFRQHYNSEEWVSPWDAKTWHVTAYSNPQSWNIRDIKPYAAYRVDDNKWIVKPPKVSKDWGASHWDEAVWDEAEAYLHLISAIERERDPIDRARRGALLYHQLHDDRRHAFSAAGKGWKDPSNALWKYLEYCPSQPVERLVAWAHEDAAQSGGHPKVTASMPAPPSPAWTSLAQPCRAAPSLASLATTLPGQRTGEVPDA